MLCQYHRNPGKKHHENDSGDLSIQRPVFKLPTWQETDQTEERQKQDWNEAVFSYNKIVQTYRSYQYDLVGVPKARVPERADVVLDHIYKNRPISVSTFGSMI